MHYPFTLTPLPYAYDALEPYIDAQTLHYHHDKHMKAYVDNLNKALVDFPDLHSLSLTQLLSEPSRLPAAIRTAVKNNGGGVYNHELYFGLLTDKPRQPEGPLLQSITHQFGDAKAMLTQMKAAAIAQFGSGYAWLVQDIHGNLLVKGLPNQDNPLELNCYPLLCVDVWEHAYYLKYKNLRADYVDAWMQVIDWNKLDARYSLNNHCRCITPCG